MRRRQVDASRGPDDFDGSSPSSVSVQPSHDPRDLAAEPLADLLGLHVRVLDRVVQQRGDRLRFGAAVVEHQRGDVEQVGEVGDVAALAGLRAVQLDGPLDRTSEARSPTVSSPLRALATFFSCSDSVTA